LAENTGQLHNLAKSPVRAGRLIATAHPMPAVALGDHHHHARERPEHLIVVLQSPAACCCSIMIQRLSGSVEKRHFGQVNRRLFRKPHAVLTTFTAMGQALHAGHLTRTASAVGVSRLAIDLLSPTGFSRVPAWVTKCCLVRAHPLWQRRAVPVASSKPGGSPRDHSSQ